MGKEINKDVVIKTENIKKFFKVGPNKIQVLFGLNTEIKRGDFTMLIGPSGCGKSTFLHTVYGLERPSEGKIIVEGNDIWAHTKNWRANFRNKRMGFIPQQPFWIKSLSVIENIAIPTVISGGSLHKGVKKAAKLIELVGMSKWADYRPYDLSGGQQQRIALARALLLNPSFIIADEPTGNLDTRSGEKLLNLLVDINQQFKITILMVTHNKEQFKFGTRIIRMKDGKIISDEKNDQHRLEQKNNKTKNE